MRNLILKLTSIKYSYIIKRPLKEKDKSKEGNI